MQIEMVPIGDLLKDPANVRTHDSKNIDAIKGSLKAFGQQKPIVIDSNNLVVAGNGTLIAAVQLGWSEIACVRTSLIGTEKTAYAIADNRTAELAAWDMSALGEQLMALEEQDFDLGAIGFDKADLDKMLPDIVPSRDGEDDIPEQVETICKPGDLWILGDHRLLCGDSTDILQVERLMDGQKADMVFTDPPYGIGYKSNWDNPVCKKQIMNDNKYVTDWIADVGGYAFCRFDSYSIIEAALVKNGHFIFNCLVWDKQSHTAGDLNSWANTHEFIVYYGKKKTTIKREQNVLRFRRLDNGAIGKKNSDNMVHPMQKPIELIEFIFSCEKNGSIYDPFLGSGSTLIACEKTGRKCFGMEIDPHYCDVIIARWEKYTGNRAKLAAKGTDG